MVSSKKQRVLIVDDIAENIRMLIETLKSEYATIPATSGEIAIEKANTDPLPDLILLDILMPGMDGYAVCAALKANPRTQDIPVIFITAVSEAMDEERAFKAGAVDYITKPFVPAVVKARVQVHLELKLKNDLLQRLAHIDGLTNIYNRRKFNELLDEEWKRTQRSRSPLALMMIDVDYFKNYNDFYGHTAGDDCLRRVARCLDQTLQRPPDTVARYGGEEFVVIMPETNGQGAQYVAEMLRKSIEELQIPHEASCCCGHVTISIGLAVAIPEVQIGTPRELVDVADRLLYEAKAQGRNQLHFTDLSKN
ncbi:response regulator receiver-modulated signal transduction diguanylate cyclase [Oleiphilus messinensis]|uniref:diguanylate cyclase n=1 Tax=Oleiphilus messinensis TaxID=141451 RepID=A0A1Y0IDE6_9GAMM|nr:diguanylate cyclase [Oleiphilus messinensis]ARU58179.1 response regulator receiver-modulated signal transduction diguanylate cyclase [Oleiphilus messinensis]